MQKQILRKFYYDKKLSMFDIARAFGVTTATVVYWMKRYKLNRRSSSESAYVKLNPAGDPFKIKQKLTAKENELLVIALMLYWAEGSRRNKHVIQLANLDSRMIAIFIKFLKNVCGVTANKICLTVQLYKDFDREKTKNYWAKKLNIPREVITVNIHADTRSKPNMQWSQYGIARIEVRNVKLKQWIDSSLDSFLKRWI